MEGGGVVGEPLTNSPFFRLQVVGCGYLEIEARCPVRAFSFQAGLLLPRPHKYVGGYQNYGPLLGPLNTRCRIIIGPKKGP